MKYGLIFAFAFGLASVANGASNNCFVQTAENLKWQTLTESEVACVISDENAARSIKSVCNRDKSDLSDHYKKYREYEVGNNQAYDEFLHSTDPAVRSAAQHKIQVINRDWPIFGFRAETDTFNNELRVAKSRCVPRE